MKKNILQLILFGGITLVVLIILYWTFFYTNFNALLALGIMIAVLFIIFFKIQDRRNTNLKLTGVKVAAKIQKVTCYSSTKLADYQVGVFVYDFRLYCLGVNPNTNQEQSFISEIMHFQPILDLHADQNINVFVDPQNPERYFVDISQIKVTKPPYLKGGNYQSTDGKYYSEIT